VSARRAPGLGYAMVPRSIIESGLDAVCFRLYAFIDGASGPNREWVVAGATEIADLISIQVGTLMVHAEHLAECDLIAFERPGRGKYVFHLLHNPARPFTNPAAKIPAPKPRARKVSKYARAVPRESHLTDVPRDSHLTDPRRSEVATVRNRVSRAEARPTRVDGLSKYAKRYGVRESDRRELETVAMCAFPGCDETIANHSFRDHEPVRISDEAKRCAPTEMDEATEITLRAFPGARVLEDAS
jgi:hypothetical protein